MPRPPRAGLKDDLIEAGERLIAKRGLAQFTARELASEVACSVGSIYNMFEDLDDLIVTIHGRTLARLEQSLRAGVVDNAMVEQNLQALARQYIAFIAENNHLWAAIFEHKLPHGRNVPDWYQARLNALFALIETVIAPLLTDDEGERRRQARILWSALHGICSLGAAEKLDLVSAESIGDLAAEMVATYTAGLRLRADKP